MGKIIKNVIKVLLVLLLLGAGALYMILPPVNVSLKMITGAEADQDLVDQRIIVPDGFRITLFATGLKGARFMRETATGDILLSTSSTGDVYVLHRDGDGDGVADGANAFVEWTE